MGQIRYPQPARPSTIILELWKYISDPSALAKGSRFHQPDGLARARTTPTKGKSTCTQQIRLLRHDIGGSPPGAGDGRSAAVRYPAARLAYRRHRSPARARIRH